MRIGQAEAESFMETLKQEEIDGRAYCDDDEARRMIGRFIEEIYTGSACPRRSLIDRPRKCGV